MAGCVFGTGSVCVCVRPVCSSDYNLPFPPVLSSQLPPWSSLPFNYLHHDKGSERGSEGERVTDREAKERVKRDIPVCLITCKLILSLNANQSGDVRREGAIWEGGIGKEEVLYVCAVNQSKAWLPVCSRLPQLTPLPPQINTIDFPLPGVQHTHIHTHAHTHAHLNAHRKGSQLVRR